MTADRPVTGRVKARWGSSAAYLAATPTIVTWSDGELESRQFTRSSYAVLSNTAVHPGGGGDAAPKIQYRRFTPEPQTSSASSSGAGKPSNRATFLKHREVSERSALPTISGWSAVALLIAFIVCLPILSVIWLSFNPQENIWPHLVNTVLGSYVWNTIVLMLGVAAGTLLIGVSTAWLVTHYEFPGRTLFNWALLLPFAIPAYVIAFIYTDLLEFAGPVQSGLRSLFGWKLANEYWFPPIRTLPGAILMLVLVLYPYVYLLARSAFLEQSASVLEAARVLGGPSKSLFFRVALPMARPAIVVGLAMALMETLNDFGTVDYFAVRTLTAGLVRCLAGHEQPGWRGPDCKPVTGVRDDADRHGKNQSPSSTELPANRHTFSQIDTTSFARQASLSGKLRVSGTGTVRLSDSRLVPGRLCHYLF